MTLYEKIIASEDEKDESDIDILREKVSKWS